MIDQYCESEENKDYIFTAFTSTTRNLRLAEHYGGNVILPIDIIPQYDAADISRYSNFHEEEEMLLLAYFTFRIQACTFDIMTEK